VITNPNPASAAIVVREFSIPIRDAAGAIIGVQNPYAEIDFKTSGGHDAYNALMLSLTRRASNGLSLNAQYTLSSSFGTTGGSNEALTAGNNARTLDEFEYDLGYDMFDVRHTLNLSALCSIPYGRGRRHSSSGVADAILGGWDGLTRRKGCGPCRPSCVTELWARSSTPVFSRGEATVLTCVGVLRL
jgi:hypothetical protein